MMYPIADHLPCGGKPSTPDNCKGAASDRRRAGPTIPAAGGRRPPLDAPEAVQYFLTTIQRH
jgi:hypothetical protein